MLNYGQLLRSAAVAHGDRLALDDEEVAYTYAELEPATARLAAGLLARGLKPGETVCWLSPNSAEFVVTYLATARAGLLFAPLNYWLRDGELRANLELLRPNCIIAASDFAERLSPLCDDLDVGMRFVLSSESTAISWTGWDDLAASGTSASRDLLDPADAESLPHEIIFTSGTTGQVKGAFRTQRQRILECLTWLVDLPPGPDAYVLCLTPQFHVGGPSMAVQVLLSGGRMKHFRYSVENLARYIVDGGTYIAGTPSHFSLLFESGLLNGVDTSKVRTCLLAGNAGSPTLFAEMQMVFPSATLTHCYGSTESGIGVAISGARLETHPTSTGRPCVGVELRVLDDVGQEMPEGTVGEICLRSMAMMTGYYRRDDLTAAAIDGDGFLHMGDLGYVDEENYLYIVGREKDMIITGGENVYPKEVEDVIAEIDEVAELAVVGKPDARFAERVVAVVRVHDGVIVDEGGFAERVMSACRKQLAGYKAPSEVIVVAEMPHNAVGKIDKVKVRAMVAEGVISPMTEIR